MEQAVDQALEQVAQALSGGTDKEDLDSSISKIRVLVAIEGESEFRELEKALGPKSTNISMHHASTVSKALEICEDNGVDCLLLADSMALSNAPKFVTQIRDASRSLSLPVIYLVEEISDETLVDMNRIGAAETVELSEVDVASLAERIGRLMWRAEVDDALTNHHLQSELVNLQLSRRKEFLRNDVEATVQALRTPLESVQEYISLILDKAAGPVKKQQGKYLELARGSCKSLDQEIGKLFDVFELETELSPADDRPHMLRDLVEIVGRVCESDAEQANVKLELLVDPKLSAVRCDALHISQTLVTLVSFGLKCAGSGGKLALSAVSGEEAGTQVLSLRLQPPKTANVFVFEGSAFDSEDSCSLAEQFDIAAHVFDAHDVELQVTHEEEQVTEITFDLPCFY